MPPPDLYIFMKLATWEFYAVEAGDSDEALERCLREKGWNRVGLVYLGRLEGHLPPRSPRLRYDEEDPPPPPVLKESGLFYMGTSRAGSRMVSPTP